MPTYQYLIIGGGMTAAAAAQGIREVDPRGSIAMISAEAHKPYNRPPLTKKLWQGKPEDSIWRQLPDQSLELISGCRITALDPVRKQVQDETGRVYGYGKLLLATGGTPRRLPFGQDEIVYYRTLDDYHTVRGWMGQGARIGVIGGGFIGSEIAASLAANHENVVMIFPEPAIGSRLFPTELAQFINRYYQQKGVEIHPEQTVQAIERQTGSFILHTQNGSTLTVDHLIAGIGIQPNTALASSAGLAIGGPEVGGGIRVDDTLRTSQPDIYAAGDVATFNNVVLQRQMRVEHEDNALTMGRTAGLNMAGQAVPYRHLPYFYSDLFDLGYEAVGELDPRLETFADWQEPFRQGVIYYLKDHQVRGVLLWNTWDQVENARQIIASGRGYTQDELKGLLPRG